MLNKAARRWTIFESDKADGTCNYTKSTSRAIEAVSVNYLKGRNGHL